LFDYSVVCSKVSASSCKISLERHSKSKRYIIYLKIVVLRRSNLGIFALFLKKNSLDKKKRWDLDQMTSVLSFSGLKKEKYTVFGDNLQVLSLLIQDSEVKEFLLQDTQEVLQEIICSDYTEKRPSEIQDIKKDRQILDFTFILKDSFDIKKNMDFVLRIVDVLSEIELSKEVFYVTYFRL
jgi:hypothetical protein